MRRQFTAASAVLVCAGSSLPHPFQTEAAPNGPLALVRMIRTGGYGTRSAATGGVIELIVWTAPIKWVESLAGIEVKSMERYFAAAVFAFFGFRFSLFFGLLSPM